MENSHLPEHDFPHWQSDAWFSGRHMGYVKSYFHQCADYIGLHDCDFYEMSIVLDGAGNHILENRIFSAAPGSIFIVPPGVRHGYQADGSLLMFQALIHQKFFDRYDHELRCLPGYTLLFEIEPFLCIGTERAPSLCLYKQDFDAISPDLRALVALERMQYAGVEVLKNMRLLAVIGLLASYTERMRGDGGRRTASANSAASMDIARSMEYIRSHLGEKLSINDLAQMANMSRSTYLRHFRCVSGSTPNAFIQLCRISYARRLLCYSQMSMTDIALECGFFDNSHFSRTFTAYEGMSPTDFRLLHKDSISYCMCTLCSPHISI
ncbi:MAG TPA: helix-turn-helix domain-containing protein [Candidatus Alectryocaccomicrobium excrementavium]|uniref:Helix-turn-helix domain-containing protein n=1 Tax=Candidatus Alectryocaccomicrobium excrementavium TaxID=2840668 RepID=A0A9D1K541_9FIRM|nr:helix-turn-helix domain-containing protein [Candidatus Alectryocaccomicrobium excrementavium]